MDSIYIMLDEFDKHLQSSEDYAIEIKFYKRVYDDELYSVCYDYYNVVLYIGHNCEFNATFRIRIDSDDEELSGSIEEFVNELVESYGYDRHKIILVDN